MTNHLKPKGLPSGLAPYKRTPVFSHTSVPKGLLKDHATKAGVWGVIHVEEGALEYVVPGVRKHQHLNSNAVGIVRPEELHHVKPGGNCRFYVEFWR